MAVLDLLVTLDRELSEDFAELRWEPLTAVLLAASEWWTRGLPIAAALVADVARHRARIPRDRLPRIGLATALALVVAWLLAEGTKLLVGRARPPDAGLEVVALVDLPGTASFPSGHATTAWAAAVALAVLVRGRAWLPALGLATLVAVSRVHLGVHFWLDVLAGAALGAAVGVVAARVARQPRRRPSSAPAAARSSTTTEA